MDNFDYSSPDTWDFLFTILFEPFLLNLFFPLSWASLLDLKIKSHNDIKNVGCR